MKPITREFMTPIQHEPKRDNRFVVEFPKDFNIEPWFVHAISRPKFSDGKWENIEIKLLDIIGPSTTRATVNLIEFCKKNKPGLFSKNKNLFSFSITALDPTGADVEKWIINVSELVNVDFGNYDYSIDDIQKIKITLKPSDCILCE